MVICDCVTFKHRLFDSKLIIIGGKDAILGKGYFVCCYLSLCGESALNDEFEIPYSGLTLVQVVSFYGSGRCDVVFKVLIAQMARIDNFRIDIDRIQRNCKGLPNLLLKTSRELDVKWW